MQEFKSKEKVEFATNRAKAVLPSLPWLSVCDVHVCPLYVIRGPIVLNMYFSLCLLFAFEFLHYLVSSLVGVASPA